MLSETDHKIGVFQVSIICSKIWFSAYIWTLTHIWHLSEFTLTPNLISVGPLIHCLFFSFLDPPTFGRLGHTDLLPFVRLFVRLFVCLLIRYQLSSETNHRIFLILCIKEFNGPNSRFLFVRYQLSSETNHRIFLISCIKEIIWPQLEVFGQLFKFGIIEFL